MTNPRWRKVIADLWGNKTRTLLVVISIAVGVFAIGAIASAQVTLSRSLTNGYSAINPASASIFTEAFDDELVQTVRRMEGVGEAEGRRRLNVRLKVGLDEWRDLIIFVIPDYTDMRVNQVQPESGAWPPPERELLIERAALSLTNAQVGDLVTIKTPDGKERQMRVAGLTYDLSQLPAFLDGTIYSYITFDTLEWLGEPRDYNELHIVVSERANDKAHIKQVADEVVGRVERSGRAVLQTVVLDPGKHPLDTTLQTVTLLMGVLGVLALFLSGFLVVTTISALLTQQTRQIGVMKAIGARSSQLIGMYLSTVVIFGLLALLLAVPLGVLGAQAFSSFMAGLLNFNVTEFHLPPYVLALQVAIGLLTPVVAGLVPIIGGTRLTVREAISGARESKKAQGKRFIGRVVAFFLAPFAFSRPMMLALRNTFRRKGRLMLTLSTLTLAGAIFIGVFSVRDSLLQTLDDLLQTWQYDVLVTLNRPYRLERVTEAMKEVPGVVKAEGWGYTLNFRVRPDGSESDNYIMFGQPAASPLFRPLMVDGRWLLPEDENAVVISTSLLKSEPDIKVGDTIVLKVGGEERPWRVVGVSQMMAPIAYVNYPFYARLMGDVGQASVIPVVTAQHNAASQAAVVRALETHLDQEGFQVSSIVTIAGERAEVDAAFSIIVVLLLLMAVLLAVVGGLGLMGTMSINVLERTREIGVMRAIGASDGAVLRVIMTEGLVIGALSWVLGGALALLLSRVLSDAVGIAFLNAPLSYSFSFSGALLWLGVVLFIAALASFLPAWRASRLTVRDVLAYEG